MFLENITGINAKENNSQAYINNWLERLENNPKWIINASSQSQRAVEHILYNR
jgi:antirestriction protein ArdC